VKNHVGLGKEARGAQREEVGRAGARADQIHRPPRIGVRARFGYGIHAGRNG
jgi:hypothetical protein